MPNFLAQIQKLDTSKPPDVHTPIESRRVRRQRQRDAAQTTKVQSDIKKAG